MSDVVMGPTVTELIPMAVYSSALLSLVLNHAIHGAVILTRLIKAKANGMGR